MKKIVKVLLIFIIPMTLLTGCEKTEIKALKDSPTVVKLEEFSLVLEAYVSRDFFPGGPPGLQNSRMRSTSKFTDQNQNDISARFDLIKQYVIDKDDVWESNFESESNSTENYIIQKSVSNGPEWDTGIKVDVVCKFVDISTGIEYKIMVEDQIIERTE